VKARVVGREDQRDKSDERVLDAPEVLINGF
jgi:hypothetical protein